MKNRFVILLIVSVLIFSGCGTKTVESQKNVVVEENPQDILEASQNETPGTESEDESNDNSDAKEDVEDDSKVGEVQQGDGFTKTPVITDKALNYTGTSGPMKYEITAIQISNLNAYTDDAAEMFGIEKDKDVATVVLDVSIENTSDNNVSFYFDQAVLTSNTKEQVNPDWLFSDNIEGDYLGNVIHSGTIIYILPNSVAEDITNIVLHVSGPMDDEFNDLSEDFTIELNFE